MEIKEPTKEEVRTYLKIFKYIKNLENAIRDKSITRISKCVKRLNRCYNKHPDHELLKQAKIIIESFKNENCN